MRQHPDPDQALFRFTWHDETDDRPDAPGDDLADDDDRRPEPPPLRDRVRARYAPRRHEGVVANRCRRREGPRVARCVSGTARPGR
jgi:hypothetical protein